MASGGRFGDSAGGCNYPKTARGERAEDKNDRVNSCDFRASGRRPDPSGFPPALAFLFALPGGKVPRARRMSCLYPNNPQAVTETD